MIMPTKATNCPGDVCEIRKKEKIQTFNPLQKVIVFITFVAMFAGFYFYIYKLENKTALSNRISEMFMSKEELKAKDELEYQKELEAFENDDDF